MKSNMVLPIKELNGSSTLYEYYINTGVKTVVLNTELYNCQGRPFALNVLNPATGTTTLPLPTTFSYNNASATISIDTSTITTNQAIALLIRYY